MLDLMKQYNDSIEKMIKILSLLVGICFVCMLFIFEISFSDEELKFFLILGCVSLLTGIGFMVSKIKKEVFDCMLFVMTGLFLGIVSGGAYSLIFMMVCLFITIIYGRRAGLLSSFLCSGILLFLETNYFGSIGLL
ncbi:phosphohydrolase, partial [Turicibacter sanguinis]|nr:phosphohydrolase [Turicibacter sanguinis]